MKQIFTIGYGGRDFEVLLKLLQRFGVEVLCDVRSMPYSERYQAFNRELLQSALRDSAIKYLFLGDLLGARPADPDMYVSGRASYAAIERSSMFRQGLERLHVGMESYNIVVMCAEKDPLDCHRSVLITRVLTREGASVQHIGSDGDLESQAMLERRMLKKYKLLQASLFESASDSTALAAAYEKRGAELAYDVDAAYRARASP